MSNRNVMQGFPPSPENQVTLDNSRQHPYSRWAFTRMRQLVPTESISNSRFARPLEEDRQALGALQFRDAAERETTLDRFLKASETDGFVALQHGKVVAEYYAEGVEPTHPHMLMSVTKSITGLVTGILEGRDIVQSEDRVGDHVPGLAGSAYGDARLRDLLDMSVALDFDENYEETTDHYARYRQALDWRTPTHDSPNNLRSYLATLKKDGEHGQRMQYASPNSDMLGWALECASGKSFASLVSEFLWGPLRAEHEAYLVLDKLGAARSAAGVCVTPRDLARVGQLLLDGGSAHGERIVAQAWIDDTLSQGLSDFWRNGWHIEPFLNARYRNSWYALGEDGGPVAAFGIYGQNLYVDFEADMVCVKLSSEAAPVSRRSRISTLRAFKALGQALSA